jgi:rare lipoprotein A
MIARTGVAPRPSHTNRSDATTAWQAAGSGHVFRSSPGTNLPTFTAMRVCALLLLLSAACLTPACAGVRARSAEPAVPYASLYEEGVASYYGRQHHGRRTASGEIFDDRRLTAAHRTLPFGTRVRVINLDNGRRVVVTVTDRGPFRRARVIDVSSRAAGQLGFLTAGTARVRLEVLSESE